MSHDEEPHLKYLPTVHSSSYMKYFSFTKIDNCKVYCESQNQMGPNILRSVIAFRFTSNCKLIYRGWCISIFELSLVIMFFSKKTFDGFFLDFVFVAYYMNTK